jgi:predicted amidohydrolase
MDDLRLWAGTIFMSWQGPRADRIRRLAEDLEIRPSGALGFVEPANVRVCAACLRLRRYRSVEDYVRDMHGYVRQGAEAGAQLVALPELTGMLPITIMPGFPSLICELRRLREEPRAQAEAFARLVERTSEFVVDIYLNTFAALAAAYGILIASGSAYVLEGGKLYNRFFLFDQSGAVAGMQDKLYLSRAERKLGVCEGEEVGAFDTRLGTVSMIAAAGAVSYAPYLIAQARQAKIVLTPASPFGDFTEAARWRCAETGLHVISAGQCGGHAAGGDPMALPAAVYGPWTASRGKDGRMLAAPAGVPAAGRIDLPRTGDPCDLYASDDNPGFWDALWR